MSTSTNDVHIKTDPNGTGWIAEGNGKVLSTHREKSAAVKSGRLAAKRHGAQFTVHRKDGTVLTTKSYGTTPI